MRYLLLLFLLGCSTEHTVEDPVSLFNSTPPDSGSWTEVTEFGRGMLDWSNRIGREIGAPDGYSPDEFESLKGYDYYFLAGRAVFTDLGYTNARELSGPAPLIAYVHLLHAFSDSIMSDPTWPSRPILTRPLIGAQMRGIDGEPVVRWYATDPRFNSYHVDERLTDPVAYAEAVATVVRRWPVDGLFIDYLARSPWFYPQDRDNAPVRDWTGWQEYQIRFVHHLRKLLGPDALLIANGEWAMAEDRWVQPWLLSGVFWERMGTLWWSFDQVEAMMKDRHGVQIYDALGSNRYSTAQVREFTDRVVRSGYIVKR